MQARSSYPYRFIVPTTGEPMMPAMLAQMLMNPTATAAADADSVSVGNTQYGGGQANAKNPVTHSQPRIATDDRPGVRLAARAAPVSTIAATQCHFRSPVRSDDHPAR